MDDLIGILEEMRRQDRSGGERYSELGEVCKVVGLEEGLEVSP